MTADEKHTNPFDEVPDWYKTSQPEGGPADSMHTGQQSVQTAERPSHQRQNQKGASPLFLTLVAVITVVGGLAVLSVLFLGSSDDASNVASKPLNGVLETGDCFRGVDFIGLGVLRLTESSCNGDEWGRVPASFVDESQAFPALNTEWVSRATDRCYSFLSDDRIAFPVTVAQSEADWLAGERRVLCGAVLPEREADVVAELNELQDELLLLADELGISS